MIDLSEWPALVLTAGLATRLRPLSDVRAKAAMPVAGEPIVGRIIAWLQSAGIRRFVLNLHHRPETITRAVGDGSRWGVEVRYSWERQVLGSAGGPARAIPLLAAERFLIVNGDTLTNCDVAAVAARHLETGALVTMAVVPGDTERYGGVLLDSDHVVRGFGQRPPVAGDRGTALKALHFIGVQAVETAAFASVADDVPSETVRTLYPALIAQRDRAIAAFVSDAEFLDIGKPADYLKTVAAIAAREGRPFDRGRDCTVAPDATLSNTVLWDRVTVGAGADLSNCILADDVTVADGSRYENCVLVSTLDGLEVAAY